MNSDIQNRMMEIVERCNEYSDYWYSGQPIHKFITCSQILYKINSLIESFEDGEDKDFIKNLSRLILFG